MRLRMEWAVLYSLLALWALALVAAPVALQGVAPVTVTFPSPTSRTPLFDLYARDDSATVAARTEYRHQVDRRVRAQRTYTWGVVTVGSLALLAAFAPFSRRVVRDAGRLHAGQLVLIWLAAAIAIPALWLVLPLLTGLGGVTLPALLYPVTFLVAVISLVAPFAITWRWFGTRASRP
jgi:hypothetical protein